jgi:negative regulator of sigma E activity
MSESEQASQLSALFDNELPAEQIDLVIRRVSREPGLKSSWDRYALIGACMRNEPLQATGLGSRVQASLAAEPALAMADVATATAPRTVTGRSWFARGAAGGAIAAGVAAVSILMMRSNAVPSDSGPPVLSAMQNATVEVAQPQSVVASTANSATVKVVPDSAPPSYTTPVGSSPGGQSAEIPLVNYVVAHSELAPSALRFSPLSSVVNGNYDVTQDTVEMTAAEIGAHR